MKVSGIASGREFAKVLKIISINAMPLAPKRLEWKNTLFNKLVATAVAAINKPRVTNPYFSSRAGPTRRINIKLEARCPMFACPRI